MPPLWLRILLGIAVWAAIAVLMAYLSPPDTVALLAGGVGGAFTFLSAAGAFWKAP